MMEQIIITVFTVWFLVGFILTSIGSFINCFTNHITDIDEIGRWLLVLWLDAAVISFIVGLIILIWS